MSQSLDNWIRGVMSGESRSAMPSLLRGALRVAEPGYAGVTSLRNRMFDRGMKASRRLPRPVISVGNLTTGGTGKTPFVQWLIRELVATDQRPAVLMRGYGKRDAATLSDEERVLRESLPCSVHASPDRYGAGVAAIAANPAISVFVLDDGFQHRRLARDLDIVLIDATNPFGYGHVLPRGMLRERIEGLQRANVVVITRVELVSGGRVREIERQIAVIAPTLPIARATMRLTSVQVGDESQPIDSFAGRRGFAVSGIGNPKAFETGLAATNIQIVGQRRFGDHHPYVQAEVDSILADARNVDAEYVLTTQKDWAKLGELSWPASEARIGRVVLAIQMDDVDRSTVLSAVQRSTAV